MANKLLVGLVFLLSCNDDNATTDASAALSLEIGTEDNGYQPIPQQGTIEAYMGPQGGFHVFLALRVTGVVLDNNEATVDLIVADASRTLDQFAEARLTLLPRDGAFQTVPAARVTLDIQSLDEVDGRALHFSAVVTDRDGTRVTGNVDATVVAVR